MTSTAETRTRPPALIATVPAWCSIVQPFTGLIRAVDTWRRRHKSSMQCARLEAHILRDLGISEAQRFIAVNTPFWTK